MVGRAVWQGFLHFFKEQRSCKKPIAKAFVSGFMNDTHKQKKLTLNGPDYLNDVISAGVYATSSMVLS